MRNNVRTRKLIEALALALTREGGNDQYSMDALINHDDTATYNETVCCLSIHIIFQTFKS
jgi:hypothetical protein